MREEVGKVPFQDEAIAHYHDLLQGDLAADSQAELERLTRIRQLTFGERPVCSVLRPRFLTTRQFNTLRESVAALMPAFRKVYRVAFEDDAFRKQFHLTEDEEKLLAIDPGYAEPSPTARLDSFFVSEEELKYTEYNAETPAGAGYNDSLSEVFLALPVMRQFQRRYPLRAMPSRPAVLQALLDTFEEWQGHRGQPPKIAILDWADVPTYSEFLIFQRYFQDFGLECQIVDPRDVEYREGSLHAGGFTFNLIYKRVLISELLQQGGIDHPVIRAVRDRAVCLVNGFRCKLLYKKASFAVLGDERNRRLFTDAEAAAIERYLPWTRVVEERQTTHAGTTIDLVPWIRAQRERLVLKPNDEYGGKGIVLGWTVDDSAWDQAVVAALASPYVVQERVRLPQEVYPSVHDGQVQWIERMLDTNPFIGWAREIAGCLTRISTEKLLNVTAGGGSTVPTFSLAD